MKASWHKSDLASVVSTLESGSRPKGGASIDTGEVASLGGENIMQSGGVTLADVKRVPQTFFKRMTKGHLLDGDVLINKDGAQTGKVGIYLGDGTGPACINEHVFLIRGNKEKISQDFLYYTLLSEHGQRQIAAQISGSAQPGLKSTFLKGVLTDIPDFLPEQAKIAEVLSTVDRAIEQTEALITKQQRIKIGMMQDLLTRGIDEQGNLRSEQSHEFKDSPLGRIPVEWDVKPLGELSRVRSGTTPSRSNIQFWDEGTIPWVKTGEVNFSNISETEEYVTELALKKSSLHVEPVGTVLVAMYGQGGTRGRCGFLEIAATTNQACASIFGLAETIHQRYLYQYLVSQYTELRTVGHGSNQVNLSGRLLSQFQIKVPPFSEQIQISDCFSKIDLQTTHNHNQLRKLRSLKTALMQDLLTGKKRVTALLNDTEAVHG